MVQPGRGLLFLSKKPPGKRRLKEGIDSFFKMKTALLFDDDGLTVPNAAIPAGDCRQIGEGFQYGCVRGGQRSLLYENGVLRAEGTIDVLTKPGKAHVGRSAGGIQAFFYEDFPVYEAGYGT